LHFAFASALRPVSHCGVSTKRKAAAAAKPLVGILMGSDSDWPKMKSAAEACAEFGVPVEVHAMSAHRNPAEVADYARNAAGRGLRVLIAGAGVAAHLPGVLASLTTLPVIGVPVASGPLQGQDALLAIVQMPPGVPVACVAIDGSRNAGLLAVQILATADAKLRKRLASYKAELVKTSRERDRRLAERIAGEGKPA
jgi:5-(carboxyamino)imidazole ribonucleotide mutase